MRLLPLFTLSETLQLLFILFSQGTPGWGQYMGAVYYGSGLPRTPPEPSPSPRGEHRPLPWEPNSPGPMFDPSPPQNVTALKDDIAYLHCIVHNRGNKTVSWIRASDLHILTVAQYTYTADDRFEVIHSPDSNAHSWTLKIKSVQPRDSGRYECQINTHPTDPITFPVDLSVFVPSAKILGLSERYVDRGSTINLTCIINFNPESPTEIFWYHNNKVINYDNRDSRVSVITDRGTVTKTILLIHDAHDAATGTYSCVPSLSATASVRIHILNGETPAAMQTNGANAVCGPQRWQHFFGGVQPLLLLLLLLVLVSSSSSSSSPSSSFLSIPPVMK
ncbi:zwei Ig domain protein zig-8-like isoform X2 [Portunus trituberculatus]|uniref:zwei Ig domain protein zig-8-like isoform X2 n=1 Tax=Portunus trituberculatus TaxID=210409 RepID=UPI001E1CCB03|nr:zwei Ig domain protein zig-8-like isoform X2 [Portunus trituberculatus]